MSAIEKTYDSILAAKYLMAIACSKGQCLNATKVQKLLYISYGIALANYNHRIVSESPQAWPFGPVFPRTQQRINYDTLYNTTDSEFDEIRSDKEITSLFSDVIDKYSGFSASKLSAWSHLNGSPWYRTTLQENFKWSTQIPDEYIREYFQDVSIY
jgi:uncharacterized phage-associated protein